MIWLARFMVCWTLWFLVFDVSSSVLNAATGSYGWAVFDIGFAALMAFCLWYWLDRLKELKTRGY